MKTKNTILGFTAFIFAIVSAFASLTAVAPEYISVQFDGPPSFQCIEIPENLACNGNSLPCKINVQLKNGSIAIAQVYELNTDAVYCTSAGYDTRAVLGHYPTGGTPILAVH